MNPLQFARKGRCLLAFAKGKLACGCRRMGYGRQLGESGDDDE
jgi:hypothetical protein